MGDISEPGPLATPQPAAPRDPAEGDGPMSLLGRRLRKLIADLRGSRSAMIGIGIVLFWIFAAVAAPLISPYSPTELLGQRLQSPSPEHWLGTDNLGRDVLSRVIWGSRTVLLLAPVSVFLGLLIGAPLGLASGYLGGMIDTFIMRVGDILLSFPTLLIYILIRHFRFISHHCRHLGRHRRCTDCHAHCAQPGHGRTYAGLRERSPAAGRKAQLHPGPRDTAQRQRADHRGHVHPRWLCRDGYWCVGVSGPWNTATDAGLGGHDQ